MKLNIQLFAYTKKEWKDLPSKDTPILAADLNNIENQLQTNTNDINTLSPDGHYGKTEIDNKENKLKAENEYLNSVIEQAFTPVEKEGTSINYDNTINARFKDIKLCGDTTQNGTPTPDDPVDVQVVTGDNTINICGKNLFNKNTITTSTYLKEDGTLQTGAEYITSDFIPVQPNTTYYKTQTLSPRIKFYDANKQPLNTTTYKDVSIGGDAGSFTTPNNAYYFRFTGNVNTSTGIDINAVMVHKGSTATTYEPYQSQTYPINLGSMELCKIGDYQDRIYKDNGKWYLNKQIGKDVLDGSEEGWSVRQGSNPNLYVYYLLNNYVQNSVKESGVNKSNRFIEDNTSGLIQVDGGFRIAEYNLINRIFLCVNSNIANTINNFKTWLSTHNTTVYYVLATPTTTEITDTTLLEQLEELAGAKTYAGETNIVATSDGLTIIPKTTALTK